MRIAQPKWVTLIVLFALVGICPPAQAVDQTAGPNDETITQWVNAALAADPRIVSNNISVSTTDGMVTLLGSVRNLAEHRFADLEAKKVKGVHGVINRIEVIPIQRLDTDIRQLIRRRIINSAVMTTNHLGVVVNNGQVTLTGTVDSYIEKRKPPYWPLRCGASAP